MPGHQPPRDADGIVIPHDDIICAPNESRVLRSVSSYWLRNLEPGPGRYLNNAVFSESSVSVDRYRGMSVCLEKLLQENSQPVAKAILECHEGLVTLNVGAIRQLGLQVGWDPRPENPYHGQVWGVRKRLRARIFELREWIARPPDVEL